MLGTVVAPQATGSKFSEVRNRLNCAIKVNVSSVEVVVCRRLLLREGAKIRDSGIQPNFLLEKNLTELQPVRNLKYGAHIDPQKAQSCYS
jgi:hypothetical protein